MNDKYISIGQLTRYIKYKIDSDVNLQEVFIKGEISNFTAHSRGHYYFTIKDEEASINAIMFSSNAKNLKFMPIDGMKVLVTGKITVYPKSGRYQISVDDMTEDGLGNLFIAYEQLKKKLEEEGLFDKKYKKEKPLIPNRIGVITAKTGAAIRDITSTINRRWPLAEVILFPALVQGDGAKESICKQIKRADSFNLDLLIVGRGGGSIEDLWAFNEEVVARAIFDCHTPIISAVGHEVDFTIADFVADYRALTPTGAGEIAVPNKVDVENLLSNLEIRLNKFLSNTYEVKKQKLLEILSRQVLKDPKNIIEIKEQNFSITLEKLNNNILNIYKDKLSIYEKIKESYVFKNPDKIFDNKLNNFKLLLSKLETLNPVSTINRGYTITRFNDKVIVSSKNIKKKDKLNIEFSDGKIDVEVI